jgi:hypothetical protein
MAPFAAVSSRRYSGPGYDEPAVAGGCIFTRTFSTPLDNQDAGNWSCMLGLAALFVETTLLGFSVYAALAHRALRSTGGPSCSLLQLAVRQLRP